MVQHFAESRRTRHLFANAVAFDEAALVLLPQLPVEHQHRHRAVQEIEEILPVPERRHLVVVVAPIVFVADAVVEHQLPQGKPQLRIHRIFGRESGQVVRPYDRHVAPAVGKRVRTYGHHPFKIVAHGNGGLVTVFRTRHKAELVGQHAEKLNALTATFAARERMRRILAFEPRSGTRRVEEARVVRMRLQLLRNLPAGVVWSLRWTQHRIVVLRAVLHPHLPAAMPVVGRRSIPEDVIRPGFRIVPGAAIEASYQVRRIDALIEIVATDEHARDFGDFGDVRCVRAVAAAPEDALDSSLVNLLRHSRLILLEVPDVHRARKLQNIWTRLRLLLEGLEISLRLCVFPIALAHRNMTALRQKHIS